MAPAPVDMGRLAAALRSPGIDPRKWIVAGTVGYRDDDGELQTGELLEPPGGGPAVPASTWTDADGCIVDVHVEPDGDVLACRWNGIAVGTFGSLLFPLRGGDNVLVLIPDGDQNSPDRTIVAVGACASRPIPTDWNNDRVLFDLNVPLEVRGPAVRIDSGNLTLNGRPVRPGARGI
jgi:hypothetical protein